MIEQAISKNGLNPEASNAFSVSLNGSSDPLDQQVYDGDKWITKRESLAIENARREEDIRKLLELVFIPNWHNKPPELPPVLTLMDVSILTPQNITAVIAAPGAGKSSLSEAICAWHLNFEADALGIEGDKNYRGVVYCDFERTNRDVWDSFSRMARRAGVPYGREPERVVIAGMRQIPRLAERMQAIELLLEKNPCSLLLLDGAGDLVLDTNDLLQAIECRIWLRELTVKYDVSIFTTLHPNPGTNKPRGHIGSEICREAECVFLAKKTETGIHVLTTEFENGKNRNGSDLTTAYRWSDEDMMFISADVPFQGEAENRAANKKKAPEPYEIGNDIHAEVLRAVFRINEKQTSGDMVTNFVTIWNNKPDEEHDPYSVRYSRMSPTRAKQFRTYYLLNGMLLSEKSGGKNRTLNWLPDDYKELVF